MWFILFARVSFLTKTNFCLPLSGLLLTISLSSLDARCLDRFHVTVRLVTAAAAAAAEQSLAVIESKRVFVLSSAI